MTENEKQSGIPCSLVGEDSNIFNLLALTVRVLKRGNRADLVKPLTDDVFASKSFEEALAHIMEYVEVE